MRSFQYYLFLCSLIFIGCASADQQSTPGNDISVTWELVSNFIDEPNAFEARFRLENRSRFTLTDKNWALFFKYRAPPDPVK